MTNFEAGDTENLASTVALGIVVLFATGPVGLPVESHSSPYSK